MKPTILLIDDDKSLLDLYALKFSLDGSCMLLTAETPEQGFEAARLSRPDLILLDLVLPKREGLTPVLEKEAGFALLGRLKAEPATKAILVVVFTNLDEAQGDNTKRAKALGASEYWVKAKLLPAEVVARVKAIVGPHAPGGP